MIPHGMPGQAVAQTLVDVTAPPVAAVCFALGGDRHAAGVLTAIAFTVSALAWALIRRNRP